MESSGERTLDYNASWNASTNWTIAGGTLVNTVSFESSLSPIDDDDVNRDRLQSPTVESPAKSPLVLLPTSPDSTSCEITITFAQKHEVRQVYVRSTARVYELYCGPELQNSSEYLCTVRCGIAARDEEVLRIADIDKIVLAHQKGSSEEIAEEKMRNLATSEDDWVEVKVPVGPLPVNGNDFLSSNSHKNSRRSSQDFYEATAEMTDTNSCISLTLRLLSLQDKGCVCVDEVYIFADPVDVANVDDKVGPMENSSGSLMAMLMPTLLQLSKMKGVSQAQDNIGTRENKKSEAIGVKAIDPINVESKVQQEIKFGLADQQEVKSQGSLGPDIQPLQLETPQISDIHGKSQMSQSRIEGVLDQLVSRVNKIEDLFLRFEESMLKPMSSIDERLQRVEQQLEVLTNKAANSGFVSCTRISAPEFSCSESETNSFYNSGSIDPSISAYEANKKDLPSGVSSIPSDSTPVSVTAMIYPGLVSCTRISAPEFSCSESETSSFNNSGSMDLSNVECEANNKDLPSGVSCIPDVTPVSEKAVNMHPGLAASAPEFSTCNDEERNHSVETVNEYPKKEQKCTLSINDALASAFAGFLSSTLVQSQKNSPSLSVKAPEFPNEEENDNDKTASTIIHAEKTTVAPICFSEQDGTNCVRSSISLLSYSDNKAVRLLKDTIKAGEEVDGQWRQIEGEEGGYQDTFVEHAVVTALSHVARGDMFQLNEEIENSEASDEMGRALAVDQTDSLEQFTENQADDGADTTQEGEVVNELNTPAGVTEEESNQDTLQNVTEFSRAAFVLDFETPILEVKFISQENSNAKTPLEALLGNGPELSDEVTLSEESGDDGAQIKDQCNLISLEDGANGSVTDTRISVDVDYCSVRDMGVTMESDKLQDYYECRNQEISTASLI